MENPFKRLQLIDRSIFPLHFHSVLSVCPSQVLPQVTWKKTTAVLGEEREDVSMSSGRLRERRMRVSRWNVQERNWNYEDTFGTNDGCDGIPCWAILSIDRSRNYLLIVGEKMQQTGIPKLCSRQARGNAIFLLLGKKLVVRTMTSLWLNSDRRKFLARTMKSSSADERKLNYEEKHFSKLFLCCLLPLPFCRFHSSADDENVRRGNISSAQPFSSPFRFRGIPSVIINTETAENIFRRTIWKFSRFPLIVELFSRAPRLLATLIID